MHLIRILQISDILAGAPKLSSGDIIRELMDWVDENSPGDGLPEVDYIVVCGNVTADGKPESFEIARQLLRDLGDKLLVQDPLPNERYKKETRFNRMMVVPGRTDVPFRYEQNGTGTTPGTEQAGKAVSIYPDFQPFKDFHDRLFADELTSRVAPFEPERALYRPMKDITLIGASYWDVENGILRQKLLEIFEAEIVGAHKQLSEFEYIEHSPKILISSAYPLYNWDVKGIYKKIREFLHDNFTISLHLFGSGSVVGVLPEPYSLPHIGLGTGPRSPEGFWPFRANLIEMCVGGGEAISPSRPLISNSVFRRREEDKFERRDHIKGQLDLFLNRRREVASQESIFDSFIKKIERAIFDDAKKFILVSGLPGSGKTDLFRLLKHQSQLGKHNVQVISMVLDNYDRKVFNEKLAKAQKEIDREPQPSDNKEVIRLGKSRDVILVVRDLYYYHLGPGKSEVTEFLNDETMNRLFMFDENGRRIKAIVYLVSGSQPDSHFEPVMPQHWMEKLVLSPRATKEIKLLVKQYSRDAPVIEIDLDKVTGGLAGFSRLLLDATKEEFDYLAGAEPICKATSAQLMEQALESSQKLKQEAALCLKVIESRHAGAAVSQHIQNEIRKIKKQTERAGEEQARKPLEVSLSVKKLKRSIKNPTEKNGVEMTLHQFESMGILQKDPSNDDLYKVRVIMPFLIGSKRPPLPPDPPPVIPIQPTTQIDFLIVTALKEEREAVLKLLPGAKKLDATDDIYTYHSATVPVKTAQGTEGSYNAIIMSCLSMGRVQAGVATASAIHRWKPRCVLLVGIAGGFARSDVRVGDILIAETIIDYELQKLKEDEDEIRWKPYQTDEQMRHFAQNFTEADYQQFLPDTRPVEGMPNVRFGNIASGDKVDARGEIITKFGKTWSSLIGIEMEAAGAAVAALQAAYKPQFFMVRGVSDLADRDKDNQVGNWWEYACDVASAYAIALLSRGPLKLTPNAEINGARKVRDKQNQTGFPLTQPARRVDAVDNETLPGKKRKILSPEDVETLADLVERSGKAAEDSRAALCANINLDCDRYFLSLPKNIDFATHLVAWLQWDGNWKSLLALCDVLAKALPGEDAIRLEEIRTKISRH